jgi:hypothetical protein
MPQSYTSVRRSDLRAYDIQLMPNLNASSTRGRVADWILDSFLEEKEKWVTWLERVKILTSCLSSMTENLLTYFIKVEEGKYVEK